MHFTLIEMKLWWSRPLALFIILALFVLVLLVGSFGFSFEYNKIIAFSLLILAIILRIIITFVVKLKPIGAIIFDKEKLVIMNMETKSEIHVNDITKVRYSFEGYYGQRVLSDWRSPFPIDGEGNFIGIKTSKGSKYNFRVYLDNSKDYYEFIKRCKNLKRKSNGEPKFKQFIYNLIYQIIPRI